MATKDEAPAQGTTDGEWERIGDPAGETATLAEGDSVEGIYLGERTVETEDLNNEGQMRESVLYDLGQPDDSVISVWGSYDLDRRMSDDLKGKRVRISYVKKQTIKGGKSLKIFEVLAQDVK